MILDADTADLGAEASTVTVVPREQSLEHDVDDYLISKRRRLTDASYREYSRTLHLLAEDHRGLTLEDFQLPRGTIIVEDFMNRRWGQRSPRTFNKNLTTCRNFFEWAVKRGRLQGDPTLPIERAKPRPVHRVTFSEAECEAILSANPEPRDQIALRLLVHYGIRKGALQGIRYEHFDRERRRLKIFTKGQKIQRIPLPETAIWDALMDLLDHGGQPGHYLLPRRRISTRRAKSSRRLAEQQAELAKIEQVAADLPGDLVRDLQAEVKRVRDQVMLANLPEVRVLWQDDTLPLGEHGIHDWWYRCLERAGIVDRGVTRGRRIHSARHTAGQRVLDKTSNLKAVQSLLGHATIGTTGDIYTEWGEDRLEETLLRVIPR